jgi:alkaline phosphatase D
MSHPADAFGPGISRRSFARTTASLAAAAVWAGRASGPVRGDVRLPNDPFTLGVASGDPAADGFVLWTRLAPRPLEGGGMPQEPVPVRWEVADDEGFARIVQTGTTVATPDWAHSVHVEVHGLEPHRWYWYRFHAAGATSPAGRSRTCPTAGTAAARLRFAVASCQHYEQGLFTAYQQMKPDEPDLVLHLGDYIYESSRPGRVRSHGTPVPFTLADYRDRHALYKTDPILQAAHACCPWVVAWDDHEVENNYADAISPRAGVEPRQFLKRRAAAYQAYYEHLPLRRASLPRGPDMRLYRRISFGDLARFFVLDSRQHRTRQPCGDGRRQPCPEVMAEDATILGAEQERWLVDGFAASPARWNLVAQQVMMARVDFAPGEVEAFNMDQWPGYERIRRRLLEAFARRPEANPVVLTGDIHSHWANQLVKPRDTGAGSPDDRPVAAELVTTSISSGGNGTATPANLETLLAENPFVRFHNAQRGYVVCDLSAKECRAEFRVVDVVDRPGGSVTAAGTFVIEDGQPGLTTA